MEQLSFHLDQFEGPLDLLLHLIQKHKLDIYDIQISQLLEQYMAYIQRLDQSDLEVASEFLEMASRLVYIKTVMLLPRHQEEGLQLKAELEGQLLEYQVCRQVAGELGARNHSGQNFAHPQEKLGEQAYQVVHDPSDLYSAYQDAVGRGKRRLPPPAKAFQAIVARRMVSVGSRVIHLLRSLYRTGRSTYLSLFESSADRGELVATFLAVLELMKAKRITMDDQGEVVFHRGAQQDPLPQEVNQYYD